MHFKEGGTEVELKSATVKVFVPCSECPAVSVRDGVCVSNSGVCIQHSNMAISIES